MQLEDDIGYVVSRLATDMRAALDRELSAYGVSATQWVILARCQRDPSITPAQLAQALSVSRPAVTGLLDRMTRAGLLERRRHRTDGRSFQLCISAEGRRVLRRVPPVVKRANAGFTAGLSATEQRQLRQLLSRVASNLEALSESA